VGSQDVWSATFWEQVHYLDCRNGRDRFLGAWFDRLANRKFAAKQLTGGSGRQWFAMPG